MENWSVMSSSEVSGAEYQNVFKGWKNTETGAEVIVYAVEGTGIEQLTDEPWAVQHPIRDENLHLASSRDDAVQFAKQWMKANPEPENLY